MCGHCLICRVKHIYKQLLYLTLFSNIQVYSPCLSLIFLETVTEEYSHITVRDGGEATLSCDNKIDDHDKCEQTDWIFNSKQHNSSVELVTSGKKQETHTSHLNRLSVTENCSLVIKNVTAEDAGQYSCRQQDIYSVVDLSVFTSEYFTSNCFVRTIN
uniref:Ig-like domain-containing protein n=1 Tax=Anabas testudineus TaxID=64144 RepID=A0AAQ6IHR8_ANATE